MLGAADSWVESGAADLMWMGNLQEMDRQISVQHMRESAFPQVPFVCLLGHPGNSAPAAELAARIRALCGGYERNVHAV
jgi:hypothetical protein